MGVPQPNKRGLLARVPGPGGGLVARPVIYSNVSALPMRPGRLIVSLALATVNQHSSGLRGSSELISEAVTISPSLSPS